ncbi:MAG: arginine--tRNA ligase [Armatimonadota bacterium]
MLLRESIAEILRGTIMVLAAEGYLPANAVDIVPELQDPRNPEHGDYATNWAMVASKPLQTAPRVLGDALGGRLRHRPEFSDVVVAGPGFINLRLSPSAVGRFLPKVLELGPDRFVRAAKATNPRRINVEFVSVNPNGPITIGSGRGAAFGSTLCNVLEAVGHTISREYYVNDGVNSEQMRVFAESVRALALGRELPETAYRGDYVHEVARRLLERLEPLAADAALRQALLAQQAAITDSQKIFWQTFIEVWSRLRHASNDPLEIMNTASVEDLQFALTGQMQNLQRDDLSAFGVEFNDWISEQSLHNAGLVLADLAELQAKDVADDEPYRTKLKLGRGGIIEDIVREEQPNDEDDAEGSGRTVWLRSTRFGDDMDRVLRRRDGRLTYIASDVSYHKDKFNRPPNADKLITILGPDHHGYIGRLRAVVAAMILVPEMTDEEALALASDRLEVVIFQLVRFLKDGKPAPMRKRDGNIYALSDLVQEVGQSVKPTASAEEQTEVGRDVVRFFYLMRSHDSTFDFDLDLAERQSDENPVFYVQYAHARIQSVIARAESEGYLAQEYEEGVLDHPKELALLKLILDLPNEVRRCAEDYGVHRLTTYCIELARSYHAFYDSCRVIIPDDLPRMSARLDLCRATAFALKGALGLLGVSAPDRMDRAVVAEAG